MSTGTRRVLQAKESFHCELDGQRYAVMAGQTRVSADHVLALNYPEWFEDLNLSFPEDEMATDNPGEARRRPMSSGKTREVIQDD